jgi:hypothetical protein
MVYSLTEPFSPIASDFLTCSADKLNETFFVAVDGPPVPVNKVSPYSGFYLIAAILISYGFSNSNLIIHAISLVVISDLGPKMQIVALIAFGAAARREARSNLWSTLTWYICTL